MSEGINQNKKLAVIGSRTFQDYIFLCNRLKLHNPSMIISGGAMGADRLSEQYARQEGLPILIFYPKWSLGKSAGFLRNTKIIEAAEEVVAFWDGASKGTLDSIDKANDLGRKLYIYQFNDQ